VAQLHEFYSTFPKNLTRSGRSLGLRSPLATPMSIQAEKQTIKGM